MTLTERIEAKGCDHVWPDRGYADMSADGASLVLYSKCSRCDLRIDRDGNEYVPAALRARQKEG